MLIVRHWLTFARPAGNIDEGLPIVSTLSRPKVATEVGLVVP